jgi:hypoxanthine-guanine phosphoribosyltransferase
MKADIKSGIVGMQHSERYVLPSGLDYEEAMDKLYG